MSQKLKCHKNLNVAKSEMSQKLKFPENFIVTKKQSINKIGNVIKYKRSLKLKYYQN